MKRLISLFLLLAMLFTGCTATEPAQTTTTPTTQPESVVCDGHPEDPYAGVDREAFYANYEPACCYVDARYLSKHFLMSGSLEVPGQYAREADSRPQQDGKFVCNTAALYLDEGNTYVVLDSRGVEVLRIFRGGGYITLE